jgi:hypothetical protein
MIQKIGFIFGVDNPKQPILKMDIFHVRSLKTTDTKNTNLFLVSIEIIDRHH